MNSGIVRFCPKHLPSCRPLSLLEQAGGGDEELLLRGVLRGMPESESVSPRGGPSENVEFNQSWHSQVMATAVAAGGGGGQMVAKTIKIEGIWPIREAPFSPNTGTGPSLMNLCSHFVIGGDNGW